MDSNQKQKLSAEDIQERLNELDGYFSEQNYKTCISKAKQLDAVAPGHGAFFLGLCYNFGYGIEIDYSKALSYFKDASAVENEYTGLAFFRCGILYMTEFFDARKPVAYHEKMVKNFTQAETHGARVASVYLAYSYHLKAMDFRGMAARTLIPSEASQANAVAVNNAVSSIEKYTQVAKGRPKDMDLNHWLNFGLNTLMLYKMACTGELAQGISTENSLGTLVKSSFRIVGSKMSGDEAQAVLAENAAIYDIMDQNGRRLVAEYFRAYCALVEADDHHSAEAFYRARWHMKMFGELLDKVTSSQDTVTLSSFINDITALYEKLQKKYGSHLISFARQGKLPNLTVSYLPGNAPAVRSCQSFMDMINELRGAAGNRAVSGKQAKKKSTFTAFMLGGIRGYNKAKKYNKENGFDK